MGRRRKEERRVGGGTMGYIENKNKTKRKKKKKNGICSFVRKGQNSQQPQRVC